MSVSSSVAGETTIWDLLCSAGLSEGEDKPPGHMQLFVAQSERVWGRLHSLIAKDGVSEECGSEFRQLLVAIAARVMSHPIIAANRYLKRFAEGVTESQARHECQQFSIFALQFDVAQAKFLANAPTEEIYYERLRVLLNEKGIPYRDGHDGELTGQWSADAVHFSWLRKMAAGLGLTFDDVAKIWLALPGTMAFVECTFDNYASIDPSVACGAAFAIENWAANSLWKPWIAGMQQLNADRPADQQIDLQYLTHHEREEQHHSQAMLDELLRSFLEPWFNADRFMKGAERMLTDGVAAYYESQLASLPEKDDSWPDSVV